MKSKCSASLYYLKEWYHLDKRFQFLPQNRNVNRYLSNPSNFVRKFSVLNVTTSRFFYKNLECLSSSVASYGLKEKYWQQVSKITKEIFLISLIPIRCLKRRFGKIHLMLLINHLCQKINILLLKSVSWRYFYFKEIA